MLAEIGDPRELAPLVDLVLDATVRFNVDRSLAVRPGPTFALVFHFHDGTATVPRVLYPMTGELSPGLIGLWDLGEAIERAVTLASPVATPAATFVPIQPMATGEATPAS